MNKDEQSFEVYKIEMQTYAAARQEFAKFNVSREQIVIVAMKEYGAAALRGCFLLNGGALVGMISLISSQQNGKSPIHMEAIIYSCLFFVFGLVLTVLATYVAYLNFRANSSAAPSYGDLVNYIIAPGASYPVGENRDRQIAWSSALAAVFGIVSVFLLAGGAIEISLSALSGTGLVERTFRFATDIVRWIGLCIGS